MINTKKLSLGIVCLLFGCSTQDTSKGILEISNEIKELVKKAQKGMLLRDEYTGGSISISILILSSDIFF